MEIKIRYILGLLTFALAFSSCQHEPQMEETEKVETVEKVKPVDTLTV